MSVLQIILTTISKGIGPNENKLFSVITWIYLYICMAKIFVKAYTYIEIGSHCCCHHVKFDHLINQNGDVPMHVGQNIGTGTPVLLLPEADSL